MNVELPFSEYYRDKQILLFKKLLEQGIAESIAKDVITSGFYMRHEKGPIYDSYYSPNWAFQGQFNLKEFIAALNGGSIFKTPTAPVSVVRSIEEMFNILRQDPHSSPSLA